VSRVSLSRAIARQALARLGAGIAPDVIAKTRLHIADAIGIALAARRESAFASGSARDFPFGEVHGPCTIIGSALTADAPVAAFANAALMHVLDYDDIHDAARVHPTTVTLAAALAAADRAGARIEGVRHAVALGNELMCRMGLMWRPAGEGPGSDWFLTQLFGYFGAALAAGIVMGFDEDRLVSALGLAYMQAAGGKEAGFGVGSNARSIYPAFAAMGGAQSALLAGSGIVGPETALDGDAGLFRIYLGAEPDEAALALLLDESAWRFRETEVKPWPCCRLSHPYVAAALAVRARLPRAPIRRVVALVNASAAKLCRPLDARRRPRTLQDAKYSIPFMTAFALAHGEPSLRMLGSDVIRDAAVLELAAHVEIEESLPDGPGHPPAVIVVETKEGLVRSPTGMPPVLDASGVRAKFDDCVAHAGGTLDAKGLWDFLARSDDPPVAELRAHVAR
jgi:2-methylcitrate dehydratase PrpD